MPLSVAQQAYAAGIIDGEGCIRAKWRRNGQPYIGVHVTNTDYVLVKKLHEWFGGSIYSEKGSYMPNAKVRHIWEVSSRKAQGVIQEVLPYLLIKKDRALLALALCELIGPPGITAPLDVQEDRFIIAQQLGAMNRKGVAHATA